MNSNSTNLNVSQAILGNLSNTMEETSRALTLALGSEDTLKSNLINAALNTLFVGLFTALTALAAYVLLYKGIKRRATAMLLVAIVLMWTSTMVYWTGTLMAVIESFDDMRNLTWRSQEQVVFMQGCLSNLSGDLLENCLLEREFYDDTYNMKYGCMATVPFIVNIVVGDMVAWWRAWVLWPGNRVVRSVCVSMALLTTILGIVDMTNICRFTEVHSRVVPHYLNFVPVDIPYTGSTYSRYVYGDVAGLSSLLANIVATTLIAYRAWMHRRTIMSYLRASSPRTQVERTLALLVESGLVYCALWVFMVAYAVLTSWNLAPESTFEKGFYYVMQGCVVPIIGMYPTLVIIVCAVDKSLHEKEAENVSIVFSGQPPRRPRETLSELLSTTSADAANEETRLPSHNTEVETNDSQP